MITFGEINVHKVFAIITGAIFPILFIVFGDITDVLTQKEAMPNMSDDVFMDGIISVCGMQQIHMMCKHIFQREYYSYILILFHI